jgi:formamidopyrimidine-DNA glycosylase
MKMTGHLLYGTYGKRKIKNEKGKIKEVWKALEDGPLNDFRNQFIHLVFSLSGGKQLVLSDMRKFAKVTVVSKRALALSEHLASIGPEPLEKSFGFQEFKARLSLRPNGRIKQILMNPEIIAGIGNIYSDEILFAAGVHPLSVTGKIPEPALRKIFRATKEILRKGINFGGDSTSDYRNPLGVHGKFQLHHRAYRNTGKACGKKGCAGAIKKLKLGGRSAHFCGVHQQEYK